MNDRENLISLLRRQGYERMPPLYSPSPAVQKKLDDYAAETGYVLPRQAFDDLPQPTERAPKTQEFWQAWWGRTFRPGTLFTNWGCAHEPGSAASYHMTHMYHPLEEMETAEELLQYPYPDYEEQPSPQMLAAARSIRDAGRFSMGNMQCTVWETAWYMRGMEVLMMDMMTDPPLAELVLDKVTEQAIRRARCFALAGADGIYLGDDIGGQSTILMSRELYCRFLKPRLQAVIDAARAVKPDIIVFYHSCGYVQPFIDDLIEAGVDVLNPIQPESMDFRTVFDRYHDRLSFCGTVGTQTTMPFGTPEQVRREVFETLDYVGPAGGLLICPTHVLEPEVPVENVIAYLDACRDYRPAGR